MRVTKWSSLLAALAICGAWATSAFPAAATPKNHPSPVLATVNGEPITVNHLLAQFTSRHGGHAKFLGGDEEARHFLKTVIEDRLLVQEAYTIGLDEDPTAQALVADYVNSKIAKELIKREIEAKTKPTKDEIEAIWKNDLRTAYRVRQIALLTREEAETIRTSILAGEDFDFFARNCSVADSSRNGGNLLVGWGRMEPAWEAVVFKLAPGELSPIIETVDGFEIVLLTNSGEMPVPELKDVSSDIESVLSRRRLEARKAEFSAELWKKYSVTLAPIDFTPAVLLELLNAAPEKVVATWNGGQLILKDVAERDELRSWSQLPPKIARRTVDERLRMTVNSPLTIAEARERKIAEEPAIAEEVQVYEDLVVESLLFRDKIFRNLSVTDEEAKKYFDEHRNEFSQVEERRVAHIMVTSEADAQKVKTELTAGGDFDALAKRYSRDFTTATSGGDLGWITAAKVPGSFKEVLTMKAGEISSPMKSESGWHVVKVVEVRAARLLEFEEAKEKLHEKALDAKKNEARQYWIDKLRAASEIEIHDAAIKKFVEENQLKSLEGASPQHQIPAGELAGPHS